jgi:hypothetical protein
VKIVLVIFFVILAIFLIVQVYASKSSEGTEQQEYEVIESNGDFEIRYYPEATMASVNVSGEYKNSSGAGFRILASYIFGGNSSDQKIAMTAPVHMAQQEQGYTMSFVMPSGYDPENLPSPDNKSILLHDSESAYTAAVRFGGFTSEEKIEAYKQKLMAYLDERQIEYTEPFVYLGYNPPYQLTNRRNEVMVRIQYPSARTN